MKNYIKLLSVIVAVLVVVVGVYAPGLLGHSQGGVVSATGTPPPPIGIVLISDSSYTPSWVTLPQGYYIQFLNRGSQPHTATAFGGQFDSGVIAPGSQYQLDTSSLAPGTYKYYSTLDGYSLIGVLTIQ